MKIYFILMILLAAGFFGVRYVFNVSVARYFNMKSYGSAAAILLTGFIVHNTLLFIGAAGLILLATVSNRKDALCRLALLVVLVPQVTCPLNIGGLYLGDLTSSDTLTVGALIACTVGSDTRQGRDVGPEVFLVLAIMFVFGIAGTRDASFTGLLRECVTIGLSLFLPFFMFSRFVRDRTEFAHVIAILGAASLILAVVAVYEATFHWSLYDALWRNQSSGFFMSRNINIRAGFLRTPTAFRESTSFAVFQLIGVFAVIVSRPLFRTSLRWALSIALCGIGLLAAQSRGADLGLMAGLVALMLIRRQFARAAVIGAAGGSVALLLVVGAASFPRVAEFLGQDRNFGSDADYRQTLLRRGIQEGMNHPLLGEDMTRVAAQLHDITQGEGIVDFVNTPLVIFLSSGLVGLVTVVVLTGFIIKRVAKRRRDSSARSSIDPVQVFVGAALIAEWTALCFTSFWERNPYWLMILIAGAKVLSLSRKKAGLPRPFVAHMTDDPLKPRQGRPPPAASRL